MNPISNARLNAPHLATGGAGMLAAIVAFAAIVPAVLLMAPAIAGQLAAQLKLGPVDIGNLFSAELGAMSIATLPAYYWLPRVDWRRATMLAAGVFIAANLASALVPNYGVLLALRFVSALAGGSLMIICMSVAAQTDNPDRAYGFWVMGQLALGAAGLAVLPGLFERYGLAVCYVLLAALMAASVPLVRHLPAGTRKSAQAAGASDGGSALLAACGIAAVLTFYLSLSGVWTFVGAIAAKAAIPAQESGNILAAATLLGVLGAAGASALAGRGGRARLLVAGYVLMLGGVLLFNGRPDAMRFAIAAGAFKLAWTFVLPFILASLAAVDTTGKLMNSTNLVIGGGLALGPALAGRMIEANDGAFGPLLIGAATVGAASLVLIMLLQRRAA